MVTGSRFSKMETYFPVVTLPFASMSVLSYSVLQSMAVVSMPGVAGQVG